MTSGSIEKSGTFTLGDLPVHRLGFGAMRVTGRGVWGPPADREGALATLRRTVELGIDLIDTADSYGPHVSEELIREALHPYPAGLVIATKAGYERTGPDQWVMNGRPEHLRESVHGSLRRLGLERIDLWQLHRIDPKVPEDEQLDSIREMQREGLIRHVGLSEVTIDQIERARKYFPVVSVQNRYNMVDREWEPVLDHCEREGIGFIPWFPLHVGKLALGKPALGKPAQGKGAAGEGALAEIAARRGAAPAQVALAWLLRRSPVMLPIPGTSKVKHLEENVAAADIELSDEEFESLAREA
jgi:pyridoxine 4-dehydrogenase